MRRNNQITGNVGMYYACYQLSRLGLNVLPTSRNAKGADIVAYSSDQTRFLTFQVKSMSKRSNIALGKSLDSIASDWWIVITNAYDTPSAYILTPAELKQTVKLYNGHYWAQVSQFHSKITHNAWERIVSSLTLPNEVLDAPLVIPTMPKLGTFAP